jgi:hypothetical protein
VCRLEMRCAELEEQCRTEKAQCESLLGELERQQRELVSKSGMLEKAMASLDAYQTELTENHLAEKASRETMRGELDQQRAARAALEDALRVSEHRRAELLEGKRTERADLEQMRKELDQQRVERLALEKELRATEMRLTQLEEARISEGNELEALRQELPRQRAARLALEGALRAAESRQQSEPYPALGTAAMQALGELVQRLRDCGDLMLQCLDPGDPRRQRVAHIVEMASRAGDLASRLLTPGPRTESTDLNAALAQMTEKLRRLTGEGFELMTILSPNLPRILVSRSRIEQLLAVLVLQARDLLPLGGEVTIETSASVSRAAAGRPPAVQLSVTASGATVRPPHEMTSLEATVSACGGSLHRKPGETEGMATFEIYLPAES